MSTREPRTDEEFNKWADSNKDLMLTSFNGMKQMLSSKWLEDQDGDYILKVAHKVFVLGSLIKGILERRNLIK